MTTMKRFGAAVAVAAMIGLGFGTTTLEAKGRKDPQGTVCSYLLGVINYPYVDAAIRDYAISLYVAAGCDVSLIK
jgi:hypothetical protein